MKTVIQQINGNTLDRIRHRVLETAGYTPPKHIQFITDTTNMMNIYRGHVIQAQGEMFYVLGDVREPRFGLEDEPKSWVKTCIDLQDGERKILKLVFHEEFYTHIGPIRMRCFRSPEKESQVIDLVQGDMRFMQGYTLRDTKSNPVRVLSIIRGQTLYDWIMDLEMPHEEYFYQLLPGVLRRLRTCMDGIGLLHSHDLCHGDIRNDHIIIDEETGQYRWIDFDLTQTFTDFDVWSLGNVLAYCVGRGMRTFRAVERSSQFSEKIKASLEPRDASVFFPYRIMNLKKLYPYIHEELATILQHYMEDAQVFYEDVQDMIRDLDVALDRWPGGETL